MPGTPDRGDHDVGAPHLRREVGRARVADRDGRVRLQEQHRGGPPDDLAAADDDRLLPGRVDAVRGQELHAADGRRGDVERRPEVEVAGVDGMEAVDVLVRRDGVRHLRLVDVPRQRKLHEDPVDLVVRVQLVDEGEHVGLRGVGRQPDVAGVDPRLGRCLVLPRDVDVRGRVVADEHRREPDVAELRDLARDVRADPLGERLSVHEGRGHGWRLYFARRTAMPVQRSSGSSTRRCYAATTVVA